MTSHPQALPPQTFLDRAASLNIVFDPGDLDTLARYVALLLDANTRFNLTAITDPEEVWSRHILDSLSLVPMIASLDAASIIDIGSGGGLPGIPLAIVIPSVRFSLLEATGKKARFLQDTAQQLQLSNVAVICDRAETVGQDHKQYRENFDIVVARAVGRLPVLLELTVPFARVGGHVLAMKGEKAPEEITEAKQALHLLHAQVTESIATPTSTVVVIEKLRKTPRSYPRRPGEPKRDPLL
jgi:16S rRNA (guanine527-N7)-methyltransferase